MNTKEAYLKMEIAKCEDAWLRLVEPGMNAIGMSTFNRLNNQELEIAVTLQARIKNYKRELRREIGLLKYIKYLVTN